MGLEAATYISQLNAAWPIGAADPKSQGDDHIRLLKSALQASFPNITGAMTLSHTQLNNAAQVNVANVFTQPQAVNVVAGATGQVKLRGSTTPDPDAFTSYYDSTDVRRGWIGYGAADSSLRINNEIAAGELRLVTNGGVIRLNGVDAADYARLSQDDTFAGRVLVTSNSTGTNGDGGLGVAAALPAFSLRETDAAANNRTWTLYVSGEQLRHGVINDANTLMTDYITVDRTGQTVDNIALAATAASFNGIFTFSKDASAPASYPIQLISASPFIALNETDAAANNRLWDFGASGESFIFRLLSDSGGSSANWLLVDRTAQTIDQVTLTTNLLQVQGIHNGTAPTGTNHYIASGTYTPTYTGLSNVDSLVHIAAQWMRVGNVVTVSGAVTLDATVTTTFTNFRMTLPIASNLANAGQLSGMACPSNNSAGPVSADTVNDAAVVAVTSAGAGALTCNYHFSYLVA